MAKKDRAINRGDIGVNNQRKMTARRRNASLIPIALLVLLGLSACGGSGGALADREEVEDRVRDLVEKSIGLSQFGNSSVAGVTCPEDLPSETATVFDCGVNLSNDLEGEVTVTFTDEDGTVEWCSFRADGRVVVNTAIAFEERVSNACRLPDEERGDDAG